MQKNLLSFFFVISLSCGLVHAQRNNGFSPEHDIFLSEVTDLFANLERSQKNQAQQYLDSFALIWNSGTLLENQKQWIFTTMNQFPSMRMRPWPDYAMYLNGVAKVLKTAEADINFDEWHKSFQSLLNTAGQRKLITLWEKSIRLFEDQTLYSSPTVKWQIPQTRYRLSFQDNTLKVIYTHGDLICYSQGEIMVISNTSAQVDLIADQLNGLGGKITWERVNLDPEKVFAQLKHYRINLSAARFEADSASFYNFNFFTSALLGKISDRIISEVKPENATFPRFESYQSIHEIKGIFPGIDFRGGFTMAGQRVLGSGTDDGDASLKFYRSDSLFVSARSRLFNIRPDRIIAERANVSIYLSGDSIYHTAVATRYLHSERELSLQRDEQGFSRAPFINTFHKLDMYCEAIYWNIDSYHMDLRIIRGTNKEGTAMFVSHDFFSDLQYMRIQALSGVHPLIRLRNFSTEYNSRTFPVDEFARYIRSDLNNVKGQMITLSFQGFLTYNHDSETVTLNDKLFHYIGAYIGRNDFDVIQLNSTAAVNARLNMNNFDLHVQGVERIPLSFEKNVILHPARKEIIMKKNRDIYFGGRIESGLFDFYGNEFHFEYDLFKIHLADTDSMSFRVRKFDADSRGRQEEVRVRTVLEGINGELLVDHPRNKSGRMPYPRYPIFNSNNESYVYYDRSFVQQGVYRRENVYFKLIPFSIDSLDHATTDNIAFDGVFISTGIFPDFYDYLTVQKDYSLGFNTKTPEQGYPIYNNKAIYKGPINMSYEGMRADGELQYLNATLHANQMLMFPDSARARINSFVLAEQKNPNEYPAVKARDVNMHYLPHNDYMSISHTTHPINIYHDMARMHGSLGLTPDGLTGDGRMEFFNSEMRSRNFEYKNMDFTAENLTLKLNTPDGKQTALQASGYNAFVDFASRSSNLKAINKESVVDFTLNRFKGFSYDFDWDLSKGDLSMQNTFHRELASRNLNRIEDWIAMDFTGLGLVSSHPRQESLAFYAGKIDFSLNQTIIQAQQAKLIKVADAAIFPDQQQVNILPDAEIQKLENASVVANTSSLYHKFYNSEIGIASRKLYSGSGMYDFVNETGIAQPIFFETIRVDRATHTTVAQAKIEKEDDLSLSPRFGYLGDIELTAANKNFNYNGAAQIKVDCGLLQSNWVKFQAEIKVDSIFIPLGNDLRNEANNMIKSALMLAGDSTHIYPAIFNRQKHYSDIEILSASGYITFDKFSGLYLIASAEKLRNQQLPENIIRINPSNCMLFGEGDLNFGNDFGHFKVHSFGSLTHDLKKLETTFDVVMGLNFYFINTALMRIENTLRSTENLTPVNLNRRKYTAYLHKKTGLENSQRLMDEVVLAGSFRRFPQELENNFFLADLKLQWNQDASTFYSVGPIGVGTMDKNMLNRYVEGFVEINKTRSGDVFNMVLIPSGLAQEGIGKDWYFIHYTRGLMQSIASDTEFNNLVRNVKPAKRRLNVERGQEPYVFVLSSDRRPFDFVRSMRNLQQR
jgi:hypothetical protein